MSDFVKKVQVNGENKLIGLDENAIDAGLKLQDGKVALNVDEYTGLGFNAGYELELRLGTDLLAYRNGLNVNQNRFRDNVRLFQEKTEIKVKTKGGLQYKNNELSLNISSNVSDHSGIYIDNYGHPHIAVDKDCGEWLKLNTEGLRLDTEAMKRELGGSPSASSVKLDPYGGLTERAEGIGVKLSPKGCLGMDGDAIGLNIGTTGRYNILLGTKTNSLYIDSVELFEHIADFVVDGATLGTKATDDYGSAELFRLTVKTHPDGCILATGDGLDIKFKGPSSADTHLGTHGGLHVDTGTLFDEIASYFGLTPKT